MTEEDRGPWLIMLYLAGDNSLTGDWSSPCRTFAQLTA
jgi:hypothetical protein